MESPIPESSRAGKRIENGDVQGRSCEYFSNTQELAPSDGPASFSSPRRSRWPISPADRPAQGLDPARFEAILATEPRDEPSGVTVPAVTRPIRSITPEEFRVHSPGDDRRMTWRRSALRAG